MSPLQRLVRRARSAQSIQGHKLLMNHTTDNPVAVMQCKVQGLGFRSVLGWGFEVPRDPLCSKLFALYNSPVVRAERL